MFSRFNQLLSHFLFCVFQHNYLFCTAGALIITEELASLQIQSHSGDTDSHL